VSDQAYSAQDAWRSAELRSAREIEQLPGVLAAAVWLASPNTVREVYIAATPDTSPDDVRAAAAELLARNGLHCSLDVIQVGIIDRATPGSDQTAAAPSEAPAGPIYTGRFLVLTGIDVHRANNNVTCRVQVQRLGEFFSGEATELDTPNGRARAAARATLAAAQLAAPNAALGLDGLTIIDIFGHPHVAVAVEAASARRVTQLTGLARVDRSIEDAAAFAALGAIERWIAW